MRSRIGAAILLVLVARRALPQDPFEIQVYDSETAQPGETGVELHANGFGAASASSAAARGGPTDRGFHLTFEPHVGVAGWAELGAYLQTSVRPEGRYEYAGAKLRFKARLPSQITGHVGIALNAEVSALPSRFSESRYGAELRPIVDLRAARAYLSVNPILDFDFEGKLAGRPQLEPAAKAEAMLVEDVFGLGAEYYAAIGPLDAMPAASRQVHRVFAVVDLMQVAVGPLRLAVNLGVGRGLAAGDEWIVKSIIGMQRR
jgi:hypothetical protein